MHKTHRPPSAFMERRQFLKTAGVLAASSVAWSKLWAADGKVTLPFENGERDLVAYPQKRPLIRLTTRPPQLETPFSVFDGNAITPNDAFFVRYHLADIPTNIDPIAYRVRVKGAVNRPLDLSLAELKALGDPMDIVAVNQCSGNSRGFFTPRVGGGQ